MAAAHRQLALTIPEHDQVVAIRCPFQCLDKPDTHQRVPMDSQQGARVTVFQLLQGIVAYGFTPSVVDGDVLLIRLAVEDFRQIDQLGAPVLSFCAACPFRACSCTRLTLPARARASAKASLRTGLSR